MIYAAFLIYAATLILIGVYSYYQNQQTDNFIGEKRTVNFWITAISAHASDMSSWLFLGFPAAVYQGGVAELWTALGLLFGIWATWRFVAPQLRIRAGTHNAATLSHFLGLSVGHKAHDTTNYVRVISAAIAIFFFTFYIASGLKGMGYLLSSSFGISYGQAIIAGIFVIVSYTLLGGFAAVTLTDFFQGVFLLVMLLIVPIVLFFRVAPDVSLITVLQKSGRSWHLLPRSIQEAGHIIIKMLSWGLGYFGLPHVLSKFMGIDKPADMRKAQYVGLSWQALTLLAASMVGLLGIYFYPEGLLNPEKTLFIDLVHTHFSPLLTGFVLCGILAATMSTVDSQLLVASTLFAHDFIAPQKKRAVISYSRYSLLSIITVAGIIAYRETSSLYNITKYAWSGLGSSFGPLIIMILYGEKINRTVTPHGAVIGIVTGCTLSALWPLFSPIIPHDAIIPASIAHGIVLYITSEKITGGPAHRAANKPHER